MTDLSPQAQAVLDAYWKCPWPPALQDVDRHAIAAALRAVAYNIDWESGDPKFLVLAIAAELESTDPNASN